MALCSFSDLLMQTVISVIFKSTSTNHNLNENVHLRCFEWTSLSLNVSDLP